MTARWTLGSCALATLLAVLAGACAKTKPGGPAPLQSGAALPECEAKESHSRRACYSRGAEKAGNPGLCLHLDKAEDQARCVAEAGRNLTVCQQANAIYPVPDCFKSLALANRDINACVPLKSLPDRAECIATVARLSENAELCASVPLPLKHDECWRNAAERSKNAALCDRVKNAHRRDQCRSSFAGAFEASPDGCTRIENVARRDRCWIELAGNEKAPDDVCERVSLRKNACYMARASRRKEVALCERVGSSEGSLARRLCYESTIASLDAFARHDACAGVTDSVLLQECARMQAVAKRDASLCQSITLPEIADDCYDGVASESPDACLRIQDLGRRRRCALQHWRRSKNPQICALLTRRNDRLDCSDQVVGKR
jgi:hypothetical protein